MVELAVFESNLCKSERLIIALTDWQYVVAFVVFDFALFCCAVLCCDCCICGWKKKNPAANMDIYTKGFPAPRIPSQAGRHTETDTGANRIKPEYAQRSEVVRGSGLQPCYVLSLLYHLTEPRG